MKSPEILNLTLFERHHMEIMIASLVISSIEIITYLVLGGFAIMEENRIANFAIISSFWLLPILFTTYACIHDYKRNQAVNIFTGNDYENFVPYMGKHGIENLVVVSMKYLGYKIIPVKTDHELGKDSCIIVNNSHLVYMCRFLLTVENLDELQKLAQENNIGQTAVFLGRFDMWDVSKDAKNLANQQETKIYNLNHLYDALYREIKTKGWIVKAYV